MISNKKLILLFVLSIYHSGYGDKAYKVINFKIPQIIWQQALHPTPVLKSPVTVTVPVSVQDISSEVDDVVSADDGVQELSTNVTQVLEDPIPAVSDASPSPVVTASAPLQDEVVTETPPVLGQVIRFPCDCRDGQCGCCTGTIMQRFGTKACGNITFIPEDFMFDVKLSVNNNTVVRRRVSASDPPPICFNPRRAPFVQICAEISNIQVRNRNAHACFEINADIGGFNVYNAPFRCFSVGSSGVKTELKPRPTQSTGPKPVSLFGNSSNDDDGDGGLFENGALAGGGGPGEDGPFGDIGDALGGFLDGEK